MYRLRGASGEEIGPYSAEQIRVLLREGRVSLQALALADGDPTWRSLDSIPEFAALSLPSPETWKDPKPAPIIPPALPPPLSPQLAPSPPAKMSGLAIASVCVGFFGFLIFPALIGLGLGIGGLVSVRRSGGRRRGGGLAVFGMLLSLFTAVTALVIAGLFISNQQRWQPHQQQMPPPVMGCSQNLEKLGAAMRQYANDHGDILPTSTNWCDSVRDFVPSLAVFTCPGAPASATCIFAMNEKVAGMNLESVDPNTVLLFEAGGGWNHAGGMELVAQRGVAPGRIYVYTAGGRVRQVPKGAIASQRWNP